MGTEFALKILQEWLAVSDDEKCSGHSLLDHRTVSSDLDLVVGTGEDH